VFRSPNKALFSVQDFAGQGGSFFVEEKLLELRCKIEGCRRSNSHKKRLHYPKDLKSEILSFLKKEGLSVSEFCKKTGFSFSTLNQWKKASCAKKRFFKVSKEESSFKAIPVKRDNKKKVYILKGLSFDEVLELLGEL